MIDFDAFLEEQKRQHPVDPIIFRVGGREYQLPGSLPAVVALDIVRLKKNQDANKQADPEVLVGIGEAMFGATQFREILVDNQLSIENLGELITQAFSTYKAAKAEAEPGPTEAPTAEPST